MFFTGEAEVIADVSTTTAAPLPMDGAPLAKIREVIYRHTFLVRLTHWVNALTIVVMIGTGLNIFNAHPRLYWGQQGSDYPNGGAPFIQIHAVNTPHGPRGITEVGSLHFDTTGVLGWSKMGHDFANRAWPSWITIPSFTDLADARHIHFFFAWLLVFNGLVYLGWSLWIRHIQRDLVPTGADLKAIPKSVIDHARLRHPTGEAAKRYNVLQRLAYLALILMVIAMVSTGLTMSPGFGAFAPWLLDLEGGRQSARTLHFLCACGITLFILVHVTEVVLAGPVNEVWSMLSGFYSVPQPHAARRGGGSPPPAEAKARKALS